MSDMLLRDEMEGELAVEDAENPLAVSELSTGSTLTLGGHD